MSCFHFNYGKTLRLSYFLCAQEQKLQDEIHRLNVDMEERDAYIKSHKSEIQILESLISQSREGFNRYKAERDKLQDERK